MYNDDEELIFADEKPEVENSVETDNPWIIMIVDDERTIHDMTVRVLDDFTFENRPLGFLNAFSGAEAKALIREHPDTAVILLDVVMETDEAGLEVARYIREELNNRFVRIILRTGQPGIAPEKSVIVEYDINDYKAKTDLTLQKLFTSIISSLRSYKDLRQIETNLNTIEKNRKGLEQIITASSKLFEIQSFKRLASGMLSQLLAILNLEETSLLVHTGFAASKDEGEYIIQAATGKFNTYLNKPLNKVINNEIQTALRKAEEKKQSVFFNDAFVGYFPNKGGCPHLLYISGCSRLSEMDRDLIRIFSRNVGIAFENISLNHEIVSTQKEVIMTLGEVVENRSKGDARHVQRIAEHAYLLAKKAGLPEDKALLIKLASPMHDIGKIGIPESILLKEGKLSPLEFETMKGHAAIGYDILKNSEREILTTAAIIAHQHQERWDGNGYPLGLKGEEIDIAARITTVVDVFDSLIHKRCYKDAWDIDSAVELIRRETGKHFDPELVPLFLSNIDEFLVINANLPDAGNNTRQSAKTA